jgi:hypothetical protein
LLTKTVVADAMADNNKKLTRIKEFFMRSSFLVCFYPRD